MSIKIEFPFFDGELPEIEGFVDTSSHEDACPSLTNEELGLKLYVDFVDPDKSDLIKQRKSGTCGQYILRTFDECGRTEGLASSNDLSEIVDMIEGYAYAHKQVYAAAQSFQP